MKLAEENGRKQVDRNTLTKFFGESFWEMLCRSMFLAMKELDWQADLYDKGRSTRLVIGACDQQEVPYEIYEYMTLYPDVVGDACDVLEKRIAAVVDTEDFDIVVEAWIDDKHALRNNVRVTITKRTFE